MYPLPSLCVLISKIRSLQLPCTVVSCSFSTMTATSCVPSSLPYAATVVLCGGFLDFGAYSSWFWTHLSTQLRSRGFDVVVVTPSPVGSLHDRFDPRKLPV
jgi:hypothetical protein